MLETAVSSTLFHGNILLQTWDILMTSRSDLAGTTQAPRPAAANKDGRQLCLTVVHHPDTKRVGDRFWLPNTRCPVSRLEPDFETHSDNDPWPLADPFISRKPFWITPTSGLGAVLAPEEHGTSIDVEADALTGLREVSADTLKQGIVLTLCDRVALLLHSRVRHQQSEPPSNMVGQSDAFRSLCLAMQRVAELDVPVLIRGETGAGKELVAQAIHAQSPRAAAPCVSINMAALTPSTAAAELFGYSKGAFTGAVRDHRGYFAQAEGGTLFLDEVGAAPTDVQAMLLRAVESLEIQPVGGRLIQLNSVRFIAATDENLEDAVASGDFRDPLYHRLAGCIIDVPPLRDRRDDIGQLLLYFLKEQLGGVGGLGKLKASEKGDTPWLPASLVSRLIRYSWPGNVRELRNVVTQIVVASHHLREATLPSGLAHQFDDTNTNRGKAQRTDAIGRGRGDDRRRPACCDAPSKPMAPKRNSQPAGHVAYDSVRTDQSKSEDPQGQRPAKKRSARQPQYPSGRLGRHGRGAQGLQTGPAASHERFGPA